MSVWGSLRCQLSILSDGCQSSAFTDIGFVSELQSRIQAYRLFTLLGVMLLLKNQLQAPPRCQDFKCKNKALITSGESRSGFSLG
jgi:hypothetical protein